MDREKGEQEKEKGSVVKGRKTKTKKIKRIGKRFKRERIC
jgi:hypothetical protein